ncbi:MAG: DNA/RNA nuclease SfsA [Clostridia bacterium]|nr:DNA/RNA nuclease SfsA [Clostridia bacterium]
MRYKKVALCTFLCRPNRFIAEVLLDGRELTVHVKNTGRCRELLVPGCRAYLAAAENEGRKTPYDLIAVEKETENGTLLINMDSQAVNDAVAEWLPKSGIFSRDAKIRREFTFERSRFDFYIEDGERRAFLEVKGVTLERDGTALFPDAPSERAVKHLRHLEKSLEAGYEAFVLFVIQMKGCSRLVPNSKTDPLFADALASCAEKGVRILAFGCRVTPDTLEIDESSPAAVEL